MTSSLAESTQRGPIESEDSDLDKRSGQRMVIFLGSLLAVVALLLVLVARLNTGLNGLVYSDDAKQDAAETFAAGQNYGVFDSNIDMRGLRKAHIPLLAETPEVVVVGGSRFQEALPEMFPDNTFYNAHVHSDYPDDMMAVTELFLRRGELPETMILSIRYQTFMPLEKRNSELWKNFADEHNAMADRLGIEPYTADESAQPGRTTELLSIPTLWTRGQQWISADVKPGPTDAEVLDSLDIIADDGSLIWSKEHLEIFDQEFARNDALDRAEKNSEKALEIDPEMVNKVELMIEFLQEQGVRVVLVQTPFHPDFYQAVEDTDYGQGLRDVQAEADRLASVYGIDAVGSFDSREIGCPVEDFIDWHHANPSCLTQIFDLIPEQS